MVFRLGGDEYALPIAHVQEVVRYSPPRPVASPVPWLRGLLSLRGTIIPVYDVAARLGRDADPASDGPHHGDRAKILIAHPSDTSAAAGLIVDDVEEVLTVATAPEALPVDGSRLLDGALRIGERMILVLDAERLLEAHTEEEAQVEERKGA